MDETCNQRLQQLEIAKALHQNQLEQHAGQLEGQGVALQKITGLISQIRWTVTGAALYYLLSSMGLTDFLKTFLKLLIGA